MRMHTMVAAVGMLLMLGGCTAATQGGSGGSRNRITAPEIAAANVVTAWDVVRRLRPLWLQTGPLVNRPVVYVDNLRQGGPNALRSLSADDIAEIRHLSGNDATTRYGTDHDGGAILVFTKR